MVRQWLLSYKTVFVLLTLTVWAMFASPPTQAAVTLVYFQADSETGRVKLSWQTQYEDGTAGYRLERSDQTGTSFLTVNYGGQNVTLIPSLGEFGGTYVAYDNTAVTGTTYTYTLYELTTSNVSRQLQSDQVVHTGTGGGSGTPTITPTVTASPTGSSGFSTPTPTLTGGGTNPTSTPTPLVTGTKPPDDENDDEATPTSTGTTSTPQVTSTVRPTGTSIAQVTPTSFPTSFPTETFDNGDNVVSAEELTPPVPIDESGYPTPENAPPIQNEVGTEPTSYPIFETTVDPSAGVPTSAPVNNLTPAASGTARVGEGSVPPTPVPIVQTPTPETTTPNRVLLWVAFLVALGIFTAGVVGTTILFTRK